LVILFLRDFFQMKLLTAFIFKCEKFGLLLAHWIETNFCLLTNSKKLFEKSG